MQEYHNFPSGAAAAHKHPRGGGWVADTAYVEASVFVDRNAKVFDNAIVFGYVHIFDRAQVFGNAAVTDDATIYGNALIFNGAQISDDVRVCDNAIVSGNAVICDNVQVRNKSVVTGNAVVSGNIQLNGHLVDQPFISVRRSDQYDFCFVDGKILAGCRNFSVEEAYAHWDSDNYRNQQLRKETVKILDFLTK